jgi:hypothetical protein
VAPLVFSIKQTAVPAGHALLADQPVEAFRQVLAEADPIRQR